MSSASNPITSPSLARPNDTLPVLPRPPIPAKVKRRDAISSSDRAVRRAMRELTSYLLSKAKDGDMRAAELIHRYYVQPMRESRDKAEEIRRNRSTPTIPANVTASLTSFRAMIDGNKAIIDSQTISRVESADDSKHTLTLSDVSGPTGGEAPANRGGGEARAWDPSPVSPQSPARLLTPGERVCPRCSGSMRGRNKQATFCFTCAELQAKERRRKYYENQQTRKRIKSNAGVRLNGDQAASGGEG